MKKRVVKILPFAHDTLTHLDQLFEPPKNMLNSKFMGRAASFVLKGISISSRFVLNRVSLHLNGKRVHLKFVKIVQKDEFVPFLLALMPEACATTKLGKDF